MYRWLDEKQKQLSNHRETNREEKTPESITALNHLMHVSTSR